MKLKKLGILSLAIIICGSLGLTGCSQVPVYSEDGSLKIIAAQNQTSPENPYTIGMEAFKKEAESRSNGRITVETHAGTIGTNENELVEKLTLGAVDVIVVSPGFMTQTGIRELDLLALPYLFESYDHWTNVIDGEVGENIAELINEKSRNEFRVLGYYSAGVRHYYGKKPINSIKDLKGLKIRTQTSGVVADFWKGVGAIPTNVSWNELYQGLQQKTVDASENAYPYFVQQSHHKTDNGKYITETGHDVTTRLVLVNGKKFDSLTDEDKQIIMEAASASVEVERNAVLEQDEKEKARAISEGAVVNKVDKTEFIKIAKPIQDAAAKEVGAEEILADIRKTK